MARFSIRGEGKAPKSALQLRVVADPGPIAEAWRTLETQGRATIFQTRAWLGPLMDTAARLQGAEPFFVLVSDAATGAPQLLLPLCRRRQGALSAIEFLDLGASDYNAPLLARDFDPSPAQFAALWSAIRAALPPADILRIDKSPSTIDGAPNPLASLPFMHRLTLGAWSLRLPATRNAYERDALGAHFRKELRRKRRRLNQGGDLALRAARDAGEARDMLRDLAAMRRPRYVALARHDILADAAFRAFYETLLARGDGLAEIHALEIGGARVAALFGLRRAGAFHFILSGFAEGEWAAKSVGTVAADCMIDRALADGLEVFDFTIGNAPYKRYFGATRQDLFGGAQALSMRALPEVAQKRLKGSLRTLLSPPRPQPPLHWR